MSRFGKIGGSVMERLREELASIYWAGVAAADPAAAVRQFVAIEGDRLRAGGAEFDLANSGRIWLIGAGKGSARMAQALEELLGERIAGGRINVPYGAALPLCRVRVGEAGHPAPDAAGLQGAREIARIAAEAENGDLVLCCISGGGSALMPLPGEGISLAGKQATTRLLLEAGATISEVNAVRKHLSALKGGQLARLAQPAQVVSLILSDVIGDPLDVIASGPTAADLTTFAEALAALRRYGLEERVPAAVVARLRAGAAGKLPETPKPGDSIFENVHNVIVANNSAAVEACVRRAAELGYAPLILSTRIEGEAREAARFFGAACRECRDHARPVAPPACLIGGGETTVTVRGKGRGGRNQELALAAAVALRGVEGIALLAAGTDGIDGPTDAAGAFCDGTTCARAEALGLDPRAFLADNDSYGFFDRLGDLFKTGPTGTNVMDLYLALVTHRKRDDV